MSDEKTEQIVHEEYSHPQSSGTKNVFNSVASRYGKVDKNAYLRQENESASHYWFRRLGQLKPVELLWADAENSELKRALNAFQLVFVGIGAIIGTGIFVLSGVAAGKNAGPAVTISFIIAAVASGKLI